MAAKPMNEENGESGGLLTKKTFLKRKKSVWQQVIKGDIKI
jgi:hypothetical protein